MLVVTAQLAKILSGHSGTGGVAITKGGMGAVDYGFGYRTGPGGAKG